MPPSARPRAARPALADDAPAADETWTEEVASDGAPHPIAALIERTLAAVTDDPRGRRVRIAMLTTIQTAAAEAGRTLPPEVHALRTRVLRGTLPWIGAGGVFVDAPDAEADRTLLDAVTHALAAVQAVQRPEDGGGYDGLFAPIHDDGLDALLRRSTIAARAAALGPTSDCVVTPPLFGRYLALCSADATADQRRVALRRGLAHVLLGHVGELAPLSLPAPTAVARAADVFALADLVPFWQVHEWRRARLGWRATMREGARAAAALAPDWDAARAADAGRLRVLLYRDRKV